MPSLKDRINQALIEGKLISQESLNQALAVQRHKGGRLSDILVDLGLIEQEKLLAVLSKVVSKPSIDITRLKISPEVIELIPPNICRQYQLFPVSKFADTLTIAMADPLNILALDDLKVLTGYKINPIIADGKKILQVIEAYYAQAIPGAIENLIEGISHDSLELIELQKEHLPSSKELSLLTREAPVISFTNKIFEDAVKLKASDILVEPQNNSLRIRMRVDGTLKEHSSSPKSMHPLVVSRIKVVSGLDIAEHRLPQEGRFNTQYAGHEVDFRISVVPSINGEKAAVRILDKSQLKLDIEALGFQDKALAVLKKYASRPHGMVLVCGPTGSGKTTTLYSLVKFVDSPRVNIVTVEDPVEFKLHGINQVNVQADIGLTFASALRSILRQDPDIIMIGEIRDSETLDIAIKSALTGHLVFSTFHTTTTCGAIIRMLNFGIEPFLITASVTAIVAQRLVRVLCPQCKEVYKLQEDLAEKLGMAKENRQEFYKAKGCPVCLNSGYKGRIALSEVLVLSPKIKELILAKAQEYEIVERARKEGMLNLREDGIIKFQAGVTSLEEVLRVTARQD